MLRMVVCIALLSLSVVAALAQRDTHTLAASRPASDQCATLSFAPPLDTPLQRPPRAMAAGDLNGDGMLDLTVAHDTNTVSVLLGKGDGTFQAGMAYPLPSTTEYLALTDLNADWRLDLAVVHSMSNTVSILLGAGNGTFGSPVSYPVGNQPSSLAVGDFNRDTHPDLAVANSGANTVSLLLGNGDGSFQPAVAFPVNGAGFIVAGDFNGDGWLDLAVTVSSEGSVQVLLGNGDGSFPTARGVSLGQGVGRPVVGDFNADGRLDLAVLTNYGNSLTTLLGNGDGSFNVGSPFSVGYYGASLSASDLNGDSRLDMAVINNGSGAVSILLGRGDGSFQDRLTYHVREYASLIVMGDFNGDTRLDVATANGPDFIPTSSVQVLLNTCPLVTTTPSFTPTPTATPTLTLTPRPTATRPPTWTPTPPDVARPHRSYLPLVERAPHAANCSYHWGMVEGRAPEDRSVSFSATDASASDDVWAVGSLIRRFDGQQWREYPIPGVGEGEGYLEDVAVLSATNVWAVGTEGEDAAARPLIVHWDGTAWTRVPAPPQEGPSGLSALAVVSATDIWAVGYRGLEFGPNGRPLVVHWDGQAWRQVTAPDLEVMGNHLQDIAAINSRDIWAVGSSWGAQGTTYLLMHWDGSTWAPASVPDDIPVFGLSHVRATREGDVWLVAYLRVNQTYPRTLLHFRDGVWQTVALPPSLSSGVGDMVVLGRNDIWLVGSGASSPAAAQWDGTAWREMEVPGLSRGLGGLTVLPNGEAWAIGSYRVSSGYLEWSQPVFYHYGPHEVALVSAVERHERQLTGLGAWRGGLWAVGWDESYDTSSSERHSRALILRRNGDRWEEVAVPSLSGSQSLNAVTALSDTEAWAVGYATDAAGAKRTLALHWDGQAWAVVPSPNVGSSDNNLLSVAASSANNVWAVGSYYINEHDTLPLALHWDGQQWTRASLPDLGAMGSLNGVVALAANDVWAVGSAGESADTRQPLLLHWDGSEWRRGTMPALSEANGVLTAVTGTGSRDVWAVGFTYAASGLSHTLTLHWNGTEWRQVPSPSPSSTNNALSGVAALSPTDVWAVGSRRERSSSGRFRDPSWNLLLHWDGVTWRVEPSPNVQYFNGLYDVAVSEGSVWGVGFAAGSGTPSGIIESFPTQSCR